MTTAYIAHLTGLEEKAAILNKAKGILSAMQQAQNAPLKVLNIQLQMAFDNACYGMIGKYRHDTFYTREEIHRFARNLMIDIELELEQVAKVRQDLYKGLSAK